MSVIFSLKEEDYKKLSEYAKALNMSANEFAKTIIEEEIQQLFKEEDDE